MDVGEARGRPTIAESFAPKHNSLNFLRLILATCVILSHSVAFLGGTEIFSTKSNLGTVAVYGFFGISGYLIAGVEAPVRWTDSLTITRQPELSLR
jgi:hypothetical protein